VHRTLLSSSVRRTDLTTASDEPFPGQCVAARVNEPSFSAPNQAADKKKPSFIEKLGFWLLFKN
jgi:hypothetical protein